MHEGEIRHVCTYRNMVGDFWGHGQELWVRVSYSFLGIKYANTKGKVWSRRLPLMSCTLEI